MAASFVETWQSCAFQQPEYLKGDSYSALLALLLGTESEVNQLSLKGNQPRLRINRLRDDDVEILVKALSEQEAKLEYLDLSYNSISDGGVAHLAKYLNEPNCTLRELDLSYNDIEADGVEVLCNSLQFNTSVNTLILNGCKLGHAGGIHVASMLQVNCRISNLGLANTDMSTDCVIAMATVLQGNQTLQSVDLSRPLLPSKMEESTIHISRMLQVNSTLKELCLSKHEITDTGAEWLCRTLKENTSLTLLNLSCNRLSRDGAKHLSGLLQLNTPLSQLDISFNRIEDEGMKYISSALASNTSLMRLNVCSNSIGDAGLCALGGVLRDNNTSLTHISIWGNQLGTPTCYIFCDLLTNSRLLADDVDVRPYEVDGVTHLARLG